VRHHYHDAHTPTVIPCDSHLPKGMLMKHTPKPSVIMGRALSRKECDKSSETVIPARPKGGDFVITNRPNGDVIIPINRVGVAMPDDTEIITDICKRMGVTK